MVFTGSSKRPPQGARKEPREAPDGKAEGAVAEDDMDSDEEKKLGATDLGACLASINGFAMVTQFIAESLFYVHRFYNGATIC